MRTTKLAGACIAFAVAVCILRSALASPPALRDDPRLQAKVTIALKCEPLSSFVAIISKATGVDVKAGKETADRNLTAFAVDMPAYEAMRQVALVLDCKWEVKGSETQRSYTLLRMKDTKLKAEQLRNEYYEKQDREFKSFIETGIQAARGGESDLQKVFDEKPAVAAEYAMFRSTLEDLGCFTKEQRDDIWAKIASSPYGEARIPFSELPEGLQKRWHDRAGQGFQRKPEQSDFLISRGGGHGAPKLKNMPLYPTLTFVGLADKDGASGAAGLGLPRPNASLATHEIEALSKAGVDVSGVGPQDSEPTDPASKSKRVRLKREDDGKGGYLCQFSDILEAAAKIYKISVFADDYLCRTQNNTGYQNTLPSDLAEGLVELGKQFGYESAGAGACYRLRNKTWYIDEVFEAPKRLVDRWKKRLEDKHNVPDLGIYTDIASSLDNFQVKGLASVSYDKYRDLRWVAFRMAGYLDQLRLCASFSASQMTFAKSGQLDYASMAPKQQSAFADLLLDTRPKLTDDDLRLCRFKVGEEHKEERVVSHDDGFADPGTSISDNITFTYIFAPGDEKKFRLETHHNWKSDSAAKSATSTK